MTKTDDDHDGDTPASMTQRSLVQKPWIRWGVCRTLLLILVGSHCCVLILIGSHVHSVGHDGLLSSLELKADALLGNSTPGAALKQYSEEVFHRILETSPEGVDSSAVSVEWDHLEERAFVVDFASERLRQPPQLSSGNLLEQKRSEAQKRVIALLEDESTLTPCLYYDTSPEPIRQQLRRPECTQAGVTPLVAYNQQAFPRTWCGKTILPGGIQRYERFCQEPVRLFSNDSPPTDGTGMPSTRLRRIDLPENVEYLTEDCDIPCQVTNCHCPHVPSFSKWTVEGTALQFTYNMQPLGERLDRNEYRHKRYLASQSFVSDIPLSSFSWEKYGNLTPAVKFRDADMSVSFFQSVLCKASTREDVWVRTIAEQNKVMSYGACEHNTDVPNDMSLDNEQDRTVLLRKHHFHLIVDMSREDDHVSESIWEALRAGVIPVYFGAPNVGDHVPPNSTILAADYGTKEAVALRIQEVANDRTLWESYHAWRKHQFPQLLASKLEFLRSSPLCRMCRFAYATTYGLRWNHTHQTVEKPSLPRGLCLSRNGIVTTPFRETWMTQTFKYEAKGRKSYDCRNTSSSEVFVYEGLSVGRTVVQHSGGIVDIVVDNVTSPDDYAMLRLELDVRNDDGAHFNKAHHLVESDHTPLITSIAIQDSTTRATVVANMETNIFSPSAGTIFIQIQTVKQTRMQENEKQRIRVIVEDVNSLRDVRTEYALSPYAESLVKDFLEPLEVFILS